MPCATQRGLRLRQDVRCCGAANCPQRIYRLNLRPARARRLSKAGRHWAPIARQRATRKERHSGRTWPTYCNKPRMGAARHGRHGAHCRPRRPSPYSRKPTLDSAVFPAPVTSLWRCRRWPFAGPSTMAPARNRQRCHSPNENVRATDRIAAGGQFSWIIGGHLRQMYRDMEATRLPLLRSPVLDKLLEASRSRSLCWNGVGSIELKSCHSSSEHSSIRWDMSVGARHGRRGAAEGNRGTKELRRPLGCRTILACTLDPHCRQLNGRHCLQIHLPSPPCPPIPNRTTPPMPADHAECP